MFVRPAADGGEPLKRPPLNDALVKAATGIGFCPLPAACAPSPATQDTFRGHAKYGSVPVIVVEYDWVESAKVAVTAPSGLGDSAVVDTDTLTLLPGRTLTGSVATGPPSHRHRNALPAHIATGRPAQDDRRDSARLRVPSAELSPDEPSTGIGSHEHRGSLLPATGASQPPIWAGPS
jgi:hypothetical protein